MINAGKVLNMLCPNVEWSIIGNKYEDINWYDKSPTITKEEFEAGFDQYAAWEIQQNEIQKQQRQALLAKLGITEYEAKLLLGGN
jgi:hypothetical protein